MQLVLTRSQKKAGLVSKSVVFILNAKTRLNNEETFAIKEYGLGSELIYSSERARKHADSIDRKGLVGGALSLAMAKLSLNVTVDSLTKGHVIECKSLDEIIGAEEAMREACETLKTYLSVAQSFDGREEVLEF